tara:strand:- start:101 stop:337 length:237 start_codon:yes stop_codon:yes gene_type:complete
VRPAPDYTVADERRDMADDLAHLLKVRDMAEDLMRELSHPMQTIMGYKATSACKILHGEALDVMLVDELNPTIRALEN